MNHQQPGNGDRPANSEATCTGAKAQRLVDAELLQIGRGPRLGDGDTDTDTDNEGDDSGSSRRDFLSLMGFSLGAVGLGAGCRAPVMHAIPLPMATPEMVPGVSLTYATTCGACPSSCTLLVKQRDGRPIKIDGNPDSPLFGGGTCATGQAALLSLYDSSRLRGPHWNGQPSTWAEIDERVAAALSSLGAPGGAGAGGQQIVLLSGTITSPSTRALIAAWARRYPNFRHVVVDAVSAGALREATRRTFGRAVVPHYRFDKARVVVALEADFLGTWLSPVEFARGYAAIRRASGAAPAMHVQIESGYSVTGSNADLRLPVPPSALGAVAAALYARLAQRAGGAVAAANFPVADDPLTEEGLSPKQLDAIADHLWRARGVSLVVSGSGDADTQTLVAGMNILLGNIGHTVDVARPSLQRQGDDAALATLIAQMTDGQVGALMIYGANPGYDHPDGPAFLEGLKHVPLSIAFASHVDETSAYVQAICPDHHFLESWGDAEPIEDTLSLAQPLIAPLFGTRAAPESLLRWLGGRDSHHDFVRSFWREAIFPRQTVETDFDAFWDRTLQGGLLRTALT
ncbi:MAG TPA: hypothetical protein VGL59_04115, partial [Polyangia bacterium]